MGIFSNTSKSKSFLRPWEPAMNLIESGVMPLLGSGLNDRWTGYGGDLSAGVNPMLQQAINAYQGLGGDYPDAMMRTGAGALPALGQGADTLRSLIGGSAPSNAGIDLGRVNDIVSALQPTKAAMLRDPYRGLTENQLPGTENSMNANGFLNSTDNQVQQAILKRGFEDRSGDFDASILNTAMGIEQSRAQQNAGLDMQHMGLLRGAAGDLSNIGVSGANMITGGYGLGRQGAGDMFNIGQYMQGLDQGAIDRAMQEHYRAQSLPLQQAMGYGNMLNNMNTQYGTQVNKAKNSTGIGNVAAGIAGQALGAYTMAGFPGFGKMLGGFGGAPTGGDFAPSAQQYFGGAAPAAWGNIGKLPTWPTTSLMPQMGGGALDQAYQSLMIPQISGPG